MSRKRDKEYENGISDNMGCKKKIRTTSMEIGSRVIRNQHIVQNILHNL
jgi:hypothetical protein